MNPRIDVVIPVRDVDDYLGDALESVAVQREVEFGSVVVVEWGRGMVSGLRDHWWDVELQREWHGTGVDTACGTYSRATEDLAADAPRLVSIRREPS